jgi:hypothetical protein
LQEPEEMDRKASELQVKQLEADADVQVKHVYEQAVQAAEPLS